MSVVIGTVVKAVAKKAGQAVIKQVASDVATKKGSAKKWLGAIGFAIILMVAAGVGGFMILMSAMSSVTGSVASGLNIPEQPPYSSVSVEDWDGGDLATVRDVAYDFMIPWPTLVALLEQGTTLAPTTGFAWDAKADPQPDLREKATAWATALDVADYRTDPIAALTATMNAPTSTIAVSAQAVMTRAATITAAAQADEGADDAPEYTDEQIESLLNAGDPAVVPPTGTGNPGGLKTGAGAWGGYSNGNIPAFAMSPIAFSPNNMLRTDASRALENLNTAYLANFGTNICVTDSYRDYASQVRLKAQKGHMAATPGKSNHGWGLALDLCGNINNWGTAQRNWFVLNAPGYGWVSPSWAVQGGGEPEPWHWEYVG